MAGAGDIVPRRNTQRPGRETGAPRSGTGAVRPYPGGRAGRYFWIHLPFFFRNQVPLGALPMICWA